MPSATAEKRGEEEQISGLEVSEWLTRWMIK
jgi:hypothetical protein